MSIIVAELEEAAAAYKQRLWSEGETNIIKEEVDSGRSQDSRTRERRSLVTVIPSVIEAI